MMAATLETIGQLERRMNISLPAQEIDSEVQVPVILITYATTEDAVRKALAAVKRDRVISGEPQLIRIEKN